MRETILNILSVGGTLALFLYGMKVISRGLQKATGQRMRKLLDTYTRNRFSGLFAGLFVTALIQSSSATTVLTASLANAGLISLSQSIGIVLGANVGTTVTAWIVSFIGLEINLKQLALPMLLVAFPFIFGEKEKYKDVSEVIIGIALMFLSLSLLEMALPSVENSAKFMAMFEGLNRNSSLWVFFGAGLLVTAIFQSSSVTSTLTILLSMKGLIDFPMAVAMIMGENVGTTITVNIAALVANRRAKQVAFSHFFVNLFGAAWMLLLFNPMLEVTDLIAQKMGGVSVFSTPGATPIGIAIFHTLFNVVNVAILINLVPLMSKVIAFIIPDNNAAGKLRYISTGVLSVSELSILQVRKTVEAFGKHIEKMFKTLHRQFSEMNEEQFYNIYDNLEQMAGYSINLHTDITKYLTESNTRDLSGQAYEKVVLYLKINGEYEHVVDGISKMSKTLRRRKRKKVWFNPEFRQGVNDLLTLVELSLRNMNDYVASGDHQYFGNAKGIYDKIIKFKKKLRKEHLSNLDTTSYTYEAGIFYTEILNHIEFISSNIYQISVAMDEYHKELK